MGLITLPTLHGYPEYKIGLLRGLYISKLNKIYELLISQTVIMIISPQHHP